MIFVCSRMIKRKQIPFKSFVNSIHRQGMMDGWGFWEKADQRKHFFQQDTRFSSSVICALSSFVQRWEGKSKCYLIAFGIIAPGWWFRMQEAIDRCYEYRSSEIRKAKIIGSTGAKSRAIPRKVIQYSSITE